MPFLTGPRCELVEPYLKVYRKKGRPVIPLGLQVLHLDKAERKISKNNNEMIVLTIRKKPEELDSGKVSYHAITIYNLTDYSYKRACDQKGRPYGILALKKFFLEAYGHELKAKSNDPGELLDQIIEQAMEFKKKEFQAIVRYKTSLAKDVFGDTVTRKNGSMVRIGQPILNYEPDLWMMAKIDDHLDFPTSIHSKLIMPLPVDQQNEYAKLFNEKIECDYKLGFLSIQAQDDPIGDDFK